MSNELRLRDQDEIQGRIQHLLDDQDLDFFGFRREVLVPVLDHQTAQRMFPAIESLEGWPGPKSVLQVEREAREYYQFALDKIRGHRGLSANRSVEKLQEYAWLLGRDDVVEAMDEADFPQYGAPKVRAWANGFKERWPAEKALVLMSQGRECTWGGCSEGCGT